MDSANPIVEVHLYPEERINVSDLEHRLEVTSTWMDDF